MASSSRKLGKGKQRESSNDTSFPAVLDRVLEELSNDESEASSSSCPRKPHINSTPSLDSFTRLLHSTPSLDSFTRLLHMPNPRALRGHLPESMGAARPLPKPRQSVKPQTANSKKVNHQFHRWGQRRSHTTCKHQHTPLHLYSMAPGD
jgi:hypothetical protein